MDLDLGLDEVKNDGETLTEEAEKIAKEGEALTKEAEKLAKEVSGVQREVELSDDYMTAQKNIEQKRNEIIEIENSISELKEPLRSKFEEYQAALTAVSEYMYQNKLSAINDFELRYSTKKKVDILKVQTVFVGQQIPEGLIEISQKKLKDYIKIEKNIDTQNALKDCIVIDSQEVSGVKHSGEIVI